MTQRRRDVGDSVKPLYASEPAEHHPSTVHPIALPAGPADLPETPSQPLTSLSPIPISVAGRKAQPAPHTPAAHPRVTYPPAGSTPIVHPATYQTSPHAAVARPALIRPPVAGANAGHAGITGGVNAGHAGTTGGANSLPAVSPAFTRPSAAQRPVINLAEPLVGRPAPLRVPGGLTRAPARVGPLLIVGGAEGMSPPSDHILSEFVRLAGGPDARIVVIATASNDPDCREIEYQRVFTRLGAGRAIPLRLTDRDQASSPEAAAAVHAASGVFFTGGDQVRITTVLGGSKVDSVLHSRVAEGMVLAGTSAGAAMMSGTMIIGGQDAAISTTSVRTAPGLEFLPGVLIDMHFTARGRLNRLLSAVAMYPHELGLGIDEDTAILVTGDRFEVLGTGSVTVIDAGPATRIGASTTGDDEPIAVYGMQLHVLPAGHQFHLAGRRPLLPGTNPEGT